MPDEPLPHHKWRTVRNKAEAMEPQPLSEEELKLAELDSAWPSSGKPYIVTRLVNDLRTARRERDLDHALADDMASALLSIIGYAEPYGEIQRIAKAWRERWAKAREPGYQEPNWRVELITVRRERDEARETSNVLAEALAALFAMVQGECPSLLEDDHHYDLVKAALARWEKEQNGQG